MLKTERPASWLYLGARGPPLAEPVGRTLRSGVFDIACATWCEPSRVPGTALAKKDEGKKSVLALLFVCGALGQMSLSVRPASTLAHLERARVGPPPCPICTDRARALFCFWHFPPGLAHSSRHRRRRPAPSYTLATRKRPVCPLRCSRCSCCRIPILAVRAAMTASRSGKWGR